MDWYLPGYRAGGPIRTVANLIGQLGAELDFRVVTRDRDLGDERRYEGVEVRKWVEVAGARVLYVTPGLRGLLSIPGICRRTPHDLVYLNSLFSRLTVVYLLARLAGIVPRAPVLLAPRGECAPAALTIKGRRKKAFLTVMSALRGFDGITWHASAEHERHDIETLLNSHGALEWSRGVLLGAVLIAPDLTVRQEDGVPPLAPKQPGSCRLVFLSRISRMKNLRAALLFLAATPGATLDIYGPAEDSAYWAECLRDIEAHALDDRVRYRGAVKPTEVGGILAAYDFLLLPTLGENFGHVIAESLVAGTPVILSDRTPWNSLEAHGAGWSISLEDEARWRSTLASCVQMDAAVHEQMRRAARTHGAAQAHSGDAIEANRALFNTAATPMKGAR
jgi:glycosyltransferase involved in cell wall biosynthesis